MMTPERWSQLERLYHEALEYPADRRAAFLAQACPGDRTLRQAVESLIAYDGRATHYLSTPPQQLPTSLELRTDPIRGPVSATVVYALRSPGPDGFHELLLRRLRICSVILTATPAALLGRYLWDLSNATSSGIVRELGGFAFVRFELISHGVAIAVSTFFALLLWWKPPTSTRGLRAIELLLIGSVAAVILWGMAYPEWYWLLEQTKEPPRDLRAFRGAYVESTSLRWFGLLVGYGSLIPNTWRRCAVVVGVLAASPLVFLAALTLWARPLDTEVALNAISGLALWIGVAAALVVFTAYRIELLHEQAAEARRLGQYALKEPLGAGGMGEVYLAEHMLLRRPCAVKLIRPERAGDPRHLRRFTREVQLTATLTHPNTVQVFDYGHTADGTFYYVMEYVNGLTLEEMVYRHGQVPPSRAVYFLRQVCAALTEAHGIGLIHRDIKPGNVMVCERGGRHDVIKLLDFGLVLPVVDAGDDETLSHEGVIAGTPAYMSPEQASGQKILDVRSDIYSVGALAYFLLTGRPPFVCASPLRTLAAHLCAPPAPPSSDHIDLPADLEAIVLRCLAKSPDERFADAQTLEKALAACRCAEEWSEQQAANWWRARRESDTHAMVKGQLPARGAMRVDGHDARQQA
jgi:serine/threonine-protein kinase